MVFQSTSEKAMGDLLLRGLILAKFYNFNPIFLNKTSWKFYEMVIRENN